MVIDAPAFLDFTKISPAELVLRHHRAAQVLKQFGIGFCCGGQATLAQACALLSINENELQKAIAEAIDEPAAMSLAELAALNANEFAARMMQLNAGHALEFEALGASLASFVLHHQKQYPHLPAMEEIFQKTRFCFLQLLPEEQAFWQQLSESAMPLKSLTNECEHRQPWLVRRLQWLNQNLHTHFQQLVRASRHDALPAKACTQHKLVVGRLLALQSSWQQQTLAKEQLIFAPAGC